MGQLLFGGMILQAGGYGASLLQAVLALIGVSILAWLVLRWASRRGMGSNPGGRMQILERVVLEPRRSLYLVKVGDRVLLVGTGDGATTLISEFDSDDVPEGTDRPSGLTELMTRLRGTEKAE